MKLCELVCLFAVTVASSGCGQKQQSTTEPSAMNTAPMVYELSVADKLFENRLLSGFYEASGGWRWTARTFSVSLDVPPPLDAPTTLLLDLTAPRELMEAVKTVSLTARMKGQLLGRRTYQEEGRYLLQLDVPRKAAATSPATVEFELDKAAKDITTGRELGVIVVGITLKHSDDAAVDRSTATTIARQGYLQMIKRRQIEMPVEKQNELMKLTIFLSGGTCGSRTFRLRRALSIYG
jgi:hypothetical protein